MVKCPKTNYSPSYSYCRLKCRCDICRTWKRLAENREKNNERARLWRLNNIERSRNNSKKYQEKHLEKVFQWQLKKYNMTVEEYYSLLEKQNKVCAICKKECNYKQRLSVDHSHTTNKVRGLLCGNCNTGLGKFKDTIEILLEAINYLKRNNGDL